MNRFKTLSKLSKPIVDEDSDIEFVDLPTRSLEDERLARELQEKERKEYRDLIEGVVNRKEGIVFRTIVNADGTLEDGSPAHPDDLERFEPWKKLFESTSGGAKVKRYTGLSTMNLKSDSKKRKHIKGRGGILETGFRIGGIGGHAVVNGTCEVYGMYTTTQANISFGHALGADRIFACRVCPSQITSNLAYSTNPPSTTNPVDEKYQSYSANGTIYVVEVPHWSFLVM
ncbi:hypothetical protein BT96DRAFT_1020773 [Gymnopus androsaceus JB14]|uniref:Uncharacterized protein n=1 Tax=Gymnopus androsaceus JB14 TaxID=1447944 RepID=A0A6A4HHU7_9AGAR|nr:hypothetical protein BT96DRAFT_1020773 [Gymnopus androsaceus JB14]